MQQSNPYRAPLAKTAPTESPYSSQASLAIGFLIDGAGVMAVALGVSQAPWFRAFLPFAAAHAVAAALIAYRASRNDQQLSAGDHFFLRYGAVVMAAATLLLRAIF